MFCEHAHIHTQLRRQMRWEEKSVLSCCTDTRGYHESAVAKMAATPAEIKRKDQSAQGNNDKEEHCSWSTVECIHRRLVSHLINYLVLF